jgi:hypothetical protein
MAISNSYVKLPEGKYSSTMLRIWLILPLDSLRSWQACPPIRPEQPAWTKQSKHLRTVQ